MSQFSNTARVTVAVTCTFALLWQAPGPVSAQSAIFPPSVRERVIGLLDLPDIIGNDFCGPTAALFTTPSTAMPPIGSICEPGQLVVRRPEGDEEFPSAFTALDTRAAIVYQRSGMWFRIALQRGSAWIRRQDPKNFKSYPEFLIGRMAYLVEGWDGKMSRLPDSATAFQIPEPEPMFQVPRELRQLRRPVSVDVIGVRHARNGVWIHVRFVETICEGKSPTFSPITGWVRAYRPSGKPAVWFVAAC